MRPMPALSGVCEPSHCAIQVGVAAVVGSEVVQVMVELAVGEGEWWGRMAGSSAEMRACSSWAVRMRRWAWRAGAGGRCSAPGIAAGAA